MILKKGYLLNRIQYVQNIEENMDIFDLKIKKNWYTVINQLIKIIHKLSTQNQQGIKM